MKTQTDRSGLVYVLQDSLEHVTPELAIELQRQIDNIKKIEESLSKTDDPSDGGLSDGECLDEIIQLFGFEVQ